MSSVAWLEEELESLGLKVMARTPFYGRGPGPGIARMNMQAATAPGRFAKDSLTEAGRAAGDAIETYSKNKQKSEMLDGQIGTILTNMTPEKQKEIETSPFKPQLDKFLAGELTLSKKESFFGSLMLDMKMDEQQKQTERQDYLWGRQKGQDEATDESNRFLFAKGGPTPLDPDPFAPPPDRQFLPSPAERFMQTEEGKEEARRIAESEMSDQAKVLAYKQVYDSESETTGLERLETKLNIRKSLQTLTSGDETFRQLLEKPLTELSKGFNADKQVKDFKEVKISYETIKTAAENPSAAGDLSLIFAYMKVLDPGSTVREGEFANAQNAAGVPDRIRNLFNNWKEGERLSTDQRAEFVAQARRLAESREKSIEPVIRQARQRFDRVVQGQGRELSPDESNRLFQEIVFSDMGLPSANQPGPSAPPVNPQAVTLPGGGLFTPAPSP